MVKMSKSNRNDNIEHLKSLLKPGDTIYTILRHVSRSGMYQAIDLVVIRDGGALDISHLAGPLLEGNDSRHNGACKASGCGMDMGFALVYGLSSILWPDGFSCIGEGCPSNDHVNGENTKFHRSGGYALRQRWL